MRLVFSSTPFGPRRGVALIIVMLMVLAMGIAVGILAFSMKVETKLATNTSSSGELEWLGLSGVEFAKWVLVEQQRIPGEQGYNGLNQFWAGGPGGNGNRIGELADDPFEGISLRDIPVGDSHVSIRIIDQERKLNINQADAQMMETALNFAGAGASDAGAIYAAILDWRDRDDLPSVGGGAETTDFYLRQSPPYRAKNGPIDDLSELLKVRGVTPELYFGPQVAGAADSGTGPDSTGRPMVGIVDLFCALSSGQLNINTAPLPVLTVALRGDENTARQIVQMRAGPDGVDGTDDDEPAKNPGDITRLLGPAGAALGRGPARFVTVSSTFEVQVDAGYGRSRRRYIAMVQRRGGRDFETLVFREE
jgi:general secretion pathway protein K